MQDAESLRHVDSFRSAMSELQGSPSWRDGTSTSKQGTFIFFIAWCMMGPSLQAHLPKQFFGTKLIKMS